MKAQKLMCCLVIVTLSYSSFSQADIHIDQKIIATGNISTEAEIFARGNITSERNLVANGDVQLRSNSSSLSFLDLVANRSSFSLTQPNNDTQIATYGGGMTFFTGPSSATNRLTITIDGKIGIGTPLPNSKLHITEGEDASLINNGFMILGDENSFNSIFDNNEIMARNNGGYSSMFLQKDGGDLLLCGDENGQVGIGITTAANLPNSEYLLAVDGKIATEDILVEPSGSWPDYVFEEGYSLKTIEQLEESIHQNGHLPGLPSAQDIKESGQHLGEVQILLLEKIEELSLYIIQQQKMIKAQQIHLKELSDKIDGSRGQ